MNLDTYQSALLHDVFVTIPSAEAGTTIAMVDSLAALRLSLVRPHYQIPSHARMDAFRELVLTEIAARGYAVHGFDIAFEHGGS
ncbi:MAG TPA: hypothetical protein VFJ62_18740 [Usitatibacter sp.]|nr:hypothetical protein [Usitatibacter sp.]